MINLKGLNLKGKLVSLTNLDGKFAIDKYRIDTKLNLHVKLHIKLLESEEIVGYILSYNYNKIDGYMYINILLNNKDDDLFIESCKIFFEYLFLCFPVRKIYYEIKEYSLNKNYIKNLRKLKFKLEAKLSNDSFFDGKYYNRYIFALYREDFYEEK